MPRATWTLWRGKPKIEVALIQALDGIKTTRNLLADTGAGSDRALFELILDESDCILCGGKPSGTVRLGGAYSGSFSTYDLRILISQIGFDDRIRVVGVSNTPPHFDGIAGFRFLSRFTYGNFGQRNQFGLEM